MASKPVQKQLEDISELELLNQFRKVILESKEGAGCLMEDEFLLPFLKSRKYNLDQAVRMLRNFFATKKAAFSKLPLVPSSYLEALDAQYICPLHGRDEEGRRILWARLGMWDTSRFTLDQFSASAFLVVNETLRNSVKDQALGYTAILDLTGFSFTHARNIGILESKNIVKFVDRAFPVKVKQVHVIRAPTVFNMVWAFVKNFLSEKMRQRHTFHGNKLDSFHESVNPSILPEELGGFMELAQAVDKGVLESVLNNEQHYQKLDAARFE